LRQSEPVDGGDIWFVVVVVPEERNGEWGMGEIEEDVDHNEGAVESVASGSRGRLARLLVRVLPTFKKSKEMSLPEKEP
jgi:hypothetical protein